MRRLVWRQSIRIIEVEANTMTPYLRVVFDAQDVKGGDSTTYLFCTDFSRSDGGVLLANGTTVASGSYSAVSSALLPILQRCSPNWTLEMFVMYATGYADAIG